MKKNIILLIVAILCINCFPKSIVNGGQTTHIGILNAMCLGTINKVDDTTKEDQDKQLDIREAFLKWRFTTNLDDRWTIYDAKMDAINKEFVVNMPVEEDIKEAGQLNMEDLIGEIKTAINPEMEKAMNEAIDQYYSGLIDIASEELIRELMMARVPLVEEQTYSLLGISTAFVDAAFDEGMKNSFTNGLVYQFDARIIVESSEKLLPKEYKKLDEDGYYHCFGQITVVDGLVTNIYIVG